MEKNPLTTFRFISLVLVCSLLIISLPTYPPNSAAAEESLQSETLNSEHYKPLIVYYSRTGTSRIVADALVEYLSGTIEEIQSTKNRDGLLGVFTCVLDQLLDRDAILKPLDKDPKNYNPVIIVAPIWIGKISSPARTFIKQAGLKGKDVSLVLTYNGSLTEDKEKALKDTITAQEITLKSLYKIITKEQTADEIRNELHNQLEKKPLMTKDQVSIP
jgi:menaquinone-dependent protoporphyrinogen IX oxidase